MTSQLQYVPAREVRVGATPKPKYGTWNEHRAALHMEAEEIRRNRLAALRQQAS